MFLAYSGREQVQQLSISKKGLDGTQQDKGFWLSMEKGSDG